MNKDYKKLQDIVDHNRAIFEPDSEAVTEALRMAKKQLQHYHTFL